MTYLMEYTAGSYTLTTIADTLEEGQKRIIKDLRKQKLPLEFAKDLDNYRVETIDALRGEVVWR